MASFVCDGTVSRRGGRVHRASLADETAGGPLLRQGRLTNLNKCIITVLRSSSE